MGEIHRQDSPSKLYLTQREKTTFGHLIGDGSSISVGSEMSDRLGE
jgi:hypothetical protein